MNICFYGVGGVGGYFGALVAHAHSNNHNIYFVARGKHNMAINQNGLTLKINNGQKVINVKPKLCTNNINNLPVCDIVILAVKSYDLQNAVISIKSITNSQSVVVPLLNGVDIYQRVRHSLKTAFVLPACVYVGTHIETDGVICQNGGNGKILLGPDPLNPDFFSQTLINIFETSDIEFSWQTDINVSIWSKFMFIAAYGLVTAAYNQTLGQVAGNNSLVSLARCIMIEIFSIANKLNINLPNNIVDNSILKAKQFPFETKTSLQRDVETKGKLNESDIFGGTIINYAKTLKIPVPNTIEVYSKLINSLG